MAIDHDKIGTITFIRLDGSLSGAGTESELVTRQGVDGVGIRTTGSRGRVSTLTGVVDATSTANVGGLHATYKAAQGTTLTIRKQGVNYQSYFIISCEITGSIAHANAIGGVGSGKYLVTSKWEVIYNAAS